MTPPTGGVSPEELARLKAHVQEMLEDHYDNVACPLDPYSHRCSRDCLVARIVALTEGYIREERASPPPEVPRGA
jgi:hypothetical protein